MRFDNDSVRNGMFVMGTQGERIGKVIRCNDETFVVEKGVFFPKDYELRYDHITDVTGGTIRYALTDFLRGRTPEEAKAGFGDGRRPCAGRRGDCSRDDCDTASGTSADRDRDEIRIPLLREEIGIEKVARESGHVRIHKTVVTEEKHFSVPVTREEVVIEHVAIGRDATLTGDDAFVRGHGRRAAVRRGGPGQQAPGPGRGGGRENGRPLGRTGKARRCCATRRPRSRTRARTLV